MNEIDKFFVSDAREYSERYIRYLTKVLTTVDSGVVADFISDLLYARSQGSTIFFIGNGGSAATASHFANDIAIGANTSSIPFKAISLTDNPAIVTAIANDFGYEYIFSKQLEIYAERDDLVVAISASGNSPNLVRAVEFCASRKIKTWAITAFDGGAIMNMADRSLHVPTGPKEYGPAEDVHMVLDHLVGSYLMRFVKDE